jgi:hypothetical protein
MRGPGSGGTAVGQRVQQPGHAPVQHHDYLSSHCCACEQLMSEFPVLAAIGLPPLENLLDKYGPDLAALLYAAELLLDI